MKARQLLNKGSLKDVLGELPLVPEVYWSLRQPGKPVTAKFDLERLQQAIPGWVSQVRPAWQNAHPGKNVLVFATLRYWVEQVTAISLALAGMGHQTSLAYLPYAVWQKPLNRFDLRRQNAYAQNVLGQIAPLVKVVSFLNGKADGQELPADLDAIIQQVALKDTQYTLQVEQVDLHSDLYTLRLERNRQAAR
ncbi:MAG: capsule polysaccharide biosynthesis family protein, partial [Deltaproteobacteria bacterium]|nr:capsule polysaccharide biosynthesis family protein [Deltaproteobacteria bacterium]